VGHARKPGAPGRTTIPPEVVARATERLLREFRKRRYDDDYHLFIVPQQCYLYLEVRWKREDDDDPNPPVTKSSTTHKPLGRLKYLGQMRKWEFHPVGSGNSRRRIPAPSSRSPANTVLSSLLISDELAQRPARPGVRSATVLLPSLED